MGDVLSSSGKESSENVGAPLSKHASLLPIHLPPSIPEPCLIHRLASLRFLCFCVVSVQDPSWEVHAQLLVAACAILEVSSEADQLSEQRNAVLSIISVKK